MRVLIADDEPAARRRLARLLAEMPPELGVETVGEAAHGLEALQRSAELAPDVLLLDISMPEVDGFDVARHLAEPRPLIIFQTAHGERALEAFDHEALDYVVKPVTRERLARALGRAAGRLGERGRGGAAPRKALERVQTALGAGWPRPRLLVRSGRGHRLVPLAEIVRFTARGGAVYAQLAEASERPHLVDYTLRELEERTAGLFVRASRSQLVCLEAVETLLTASDGSLALTLAGGATVRVSRRRSAAVRRALGG